MDNRQMTEELNQLKQKLRNYDSAILKGEQLLLEEEKDTNDYKKDLDEAISEQQNAVKEYSNVLMRIKSGRYSSEQCNNMESMASDDIYFKTEWVNKWQGFYNRSVERQQSIKADLTQTRAQRGEILANIQKLEQQIYGSVQTKSTNTASKGKSCLGSLIVWGIIIYLILHFCGKV